MGFLLQIIFFFCFKWELQSGFIYAFKVTMFERYLMTTKQVLSQWGSYMFSFFLRMFVSWKLVAIRAHKLFGFSVHCRAQIVAVRINVVFKCRRVFVSRLSFRFGHKKLVANQTVKFAVKKYEKGLMQIGPETIPASFERITNSWTHDRVQVDVCGEWQGLQNHIMIQTHETYGHECPMKIAQWLHVVNATQSHQVERSYEHQRVMYVIRCYFEW